MPLCIRVAIAAICRGWFDPPTSMTASSLQNRAVTLFCAISFFHAALALSQGTGLTGQYYDTATFTTLRTTRVDTEFDFAWGTGIPAGTTITNGDTFSVAWSGQIEPEFSELCTF